MSPANASAAAVTAGHVARVEVDFAPVVPDRLAVVAGRAGKGNRRAVIIARADQEAPEVPVADRKADRAAMTGAMIVVVVRGNDLNHASRCRCRNWSARSCPTKRAWIR